MDKWEYKCELIGDPTRGAGDALGDIQAYLNSVADEGWRLIVITPAKYGICGIFERAVEEPGLEPDLETMDSAAWMELNEATCGLRKVLTQAHDRGDWDGSFDQLVEIAAGNVKIKGIGPAGQKQLAELLESQ